MIGRLALLTTLLLAAPLPALAAPDVVVARVDGPHGSFTIGLNRLQAYVDAHPDRSARDALDELIAFELLAAEADAAGHADASVVADAARQATVAAYLRDEFEIAWRPDTLPVELARQSYDSNKSFFDHPQLREGAHILVTTPDSKRPEGDLDAQAQALAERIGANLRADPPSGPDTFRARGKVFDDDAKRLGLEIKAQTLGRFARRGRFADEFAQVAFQIEETGVPSDPFPSRFGWHIVLIDQIIPEKRQTFEAAEAEIRQKIAPDVQRYQLLKLTDTLAAALPALRDSPGVRGLIDARPLDAIAIRRGLLPAAAPNPAPAPRPTPQR